MKVLFVLLLIAVLTAACNLSSQPNRPLPTPSEPPAAAPQLATPLQSPVPQLATPLPITQIASPASSVTQSPLTAGTLMALPLPTSLPVPGAQQSLPAQPIANLGNTGAQCAVYVTYSGVDPANKLSLRAQPSADAAQLFKLPNNTQVYLKPGAQEVDAEGYHWLNIVYIDPTQTRYEGWAARDSYIFNGVRDPSIATLRATGQQVPC
jgi:hypothetical protein